MTKPIIQHYIPRWYLQNFSANYDKSRRDGNIWVYKKKTKKIKIKTISLTAQGRYFYDQSGTFEISYLNPLETRTARTIGTIVHKQNIQGFSQSSINTILEFVLLQSQRTAASKEFVKRFIDGYTKDKFPQIKKITKTYEYYELAFQYQIKQILADIEILSDLKIFLLSNSTKIPFITSDYPIVKNNYFYPNIGSHGLVTPGLQFFIPINEKICLLLIHEELYENLARHESEIEITCENDVHSINCLQILNSYKYLFSKYDATKNISKSNKIARLIKLDFEREFGKTRMDRRYDDLYDRNYSIPVSFLNAKLKPNLSQYNNHPKNPVRDKSRYDAAFARQESELSMFKQDLHALFEREIPAE